MKLRYKKLPKKQNNEVSNLEDLIFILKNLRQVN